MWRKLEPRADWQIALAITAALRVVYTGVAAVAAIVLHPDARLIQSNVLTENLPASGGWHYALLGIWERFDTLWYLRIAESGYDLPAGVVFYPLYPGLIRGLSGLAGPMAAALLISTVAAFFYFWGLLRLVENEMRSEFPNTQPLRTVMLAAVWPASFFFFAGYTEALAVALIVWCIVWARDERWVLAAACAFATGLTRSAGTLVIVPLAILAWRAPRQARWPQPRGARRGVSRRRRLANVGLVSNGAFRGGRHRSAKRLCTLCVPGDQPADLNGVSCNHEMCGSLYLDGNRADDARGEEGIGTLYRRVTEFAPQNEDRDIDRRQRGRG